MNKISKTTKVSKIIRVSVFTLSLLFFIAAFLAPQGSGSLQARAADTGTDTETNPPDNQTQQEEDYRPRRSINEEPAEPAEPVIPGHIVRRSDGSAVTSGIGGIYAANHKIRGIAVAASQETVKAAMAVNDPDTSLSCYSSDSVNQEKAKQLEEIAAEQGKKAVAVFSTDLYSITKNGTVTAIRESASPIPLAVGVPADLRGKTFSIICTDTDGNTVIFEDMDTDTWTITIHVKMFGTYALVYED